MPYKYNPFTNRLDYYEAVPAVLPPSGGGTGISSYTTGDILYASDATTLAKLPIGSAGEVLTVAGGLPDWLPAGGGGGVTGPGSSTNRAISTWNGTAGDELYDNPSAKIDSGGRLTNSAQPSFSAYMTANLDNATGDGTGVQIPFNATSYDNGGDYNTSSYQFQAPVDGVYLFTGLVYTYGFTSSHTVAFMQIAVGAGTYQPYTINPWLMGANQTLSLPFSFQAKMVAGDLAKLSWFVYGGSKIIGIAGGALNSGFQGVLLPA
jgi:hypothetical protein